MRIPQEKHVLNEGYQPNMFCHRRATSGKMEAIDRLKKKLVIRVSARHFKLGLQLIRGNGTYPVKLLGRWLNRAYYRRLLLWKYNKNGINIFARDWDNLLLLDGCRCELLAEHPFDAELQTVTSRGSATSEFLYGNCQDTDLSDTVYISGNPVLSWYEQVIEANFHDVIYVWKQDGWDQQYKTVLPEDMVEYTREAAETYPNKRLFVHFLQPHYPFIDSTIEADKKQFHDPDDVHLSFWRAVEAGNVDLSKADIWELYEANLERALPHVEELCSDLSGRTVITSDHGNMIGESSFPIPIEEWGHPPGVYTEELVTVPWIEIDNGSRRRIIAGHGDRDTEEDRSVARERMEDLGYVV